MSLFIKYGIPVVSIGILFGISLLIYKRIDSSLSKNQTKEKEIKQKIIIKDKKTSLRNIINYIYSASLAIVMVAPVIYIFDLLYRLLFPILPKETASQLIAVIYVTIACISDMVLIIFAYKWLKNNFALTDLKMKK